MSLPKENLDNKAFSDFLKEAISRIPVYAPEWTDHNVHDPGITFIELFAWLTEMQIYRLNRISDRSYRKFLKLMGIPKLKSANAAKVDVTFSLLLDVMKVEVPAGTIVAATDPETGEDILFETEQDLNVVSTELNSVTAVHAIQRKNSNECTFSSSGLPDFHIDIKFAPVVDKTLTVNIKDDIWIEVEDFDASKPGDKHYTVDLISGRVTFGNGINGKIPPTGVDNITVSYRSGGGIRGNVKAGTITRVLSESLIGIVTVTNAKAASGGTDAETLEEAKQRARNELKEVTRAVTSSDYEQLALKTPKVWVARAKALPRYHPSQDREVPGIISVVVVQTSSPVNPNPIPSQDFLRAVYRHLEEYRLLTTELFVLAPEYVNISVEATVIVKPKSLRDKVKTDVEEKLEEFFDPVSGGLDRKGWPFGRHVYISEIYEVIDGVEGVDYVIPDSVILKENGNVQKFEIDVPSKDLVYLDMEKTKITAEEEIHVF